MKIPTIDTSKLCAHYCMMIHLSQLTWMCRRILSYVNTTSGEEHMISYLPLSHVAPQLLDVYLPMATAGTCWFAQPDALKGSLLNTMKEVRPTMFLGVPRYVGVT